jgi:hypothetical protein
MSDANLTTDTLLDRAAITDCLHRYTRGIDRFRPDLVRSAYHDDAMDDHCGVVLPVGEFVDGAFGPEDEQIRHRQHYLSNVTIELDGDVAHTETYYTSVNTYVDETQPLLVAGGRYVDRFERRDGRWAIAVRVCTAEWIMRPESSLSSEQAARRGAGATCDDDDVSFRRPLNVLSQA